MYLKTSITSAMKIMIAKNMVWSSCIYYFILIGFSDARAVRPYKLPRQPVTKIGVGLCQNVVQKGRKNAWIVPNFDTI